ncbi:uncharacterized protein FRV6_11743 [Fusarium oxysporum]|uniref:Uncharacterized protein n=1 Tax=Fusarium oxysporum TaxID=5507 RepID=A0A2H3TWB9_FUSOX|nr:uncharacterized protein FRV6_11743 [Fusarium oxysporum]
MADLQYALDTEGLRGRVWQKN